MTRRGVPLERLADTGLAGPGLSEAAAVTRRERYGANAIVEVVAGAWRELLRETAKDPMLWFFAATSALYALVGQRAEALTLLVAILPLVLMDGVLHRRTRASTEGLRSRLAAEAVVVRDGVERAVPALDVVPGDLVRVRPGEPFAADGVIVEGAGLQVDESTLTGEAYPVAKRPLAALAGAPEPAIEHAHWAFAGTRLLTGRARVRVVFTGGETLYGEIVRSAGTGAHARTPLQRAIQRLVQRLIILAALFCVVLAGVRLAQGHGWLDALVSAVTLAAAAIPEEFPIVFTIFLAVGVYRLARRDALVRRAVSVENIGRVTAICSDKTGTITEGRLRLAVQVPAAGLGKRDLVALAAGAARSESGDPLDAAILDAAGPDGRLTVLAMFPFTEARRREGAVVREADGGTSVIVKGAVETVLAMCALGDEEREGWSHEATKLGESGRRVIACARRSVGGAGPAAEPADGYALAGLLAFEDPVRPGVAEAVAECRAAGIHTIMVTGDHPATARAVAREIGLGGGEPSVVTGEELAGRDGAALRTLDVVARASPGHKLDLVRALQADRQVVVVTGDGVNDVPALQAADVGVAMGERGTRSAREVAAIVLLDDNFRTIVRAVAEGRRLFSNLRAAFQYLLVVHIPLVLTAALVPLAGYPLLYLPVHIVWLEMLIHPTAMLAFQIGGAGRALAPARAQAFFARADWARVLGAGAILTAAVVAGYARGLGDGGDVPHARALALATLTLGSAAVTAVLTRLADRLARLVVAGTVILSAALIQAGPLALRLHVTPLHLGDWLLTLAGALLATAPLALGGGGGRR
jgi:P-type Ca2+ transporter type 2C